MSETPEDYFRQPTPRRVPFELRLGPYGLGLRNWAAFHLFFGALCLLASQFDWFGQLKFIVLPLGYLEYFGALGLVISFIQTWRWLGNGGRYRYLRYGELCQGTVNKVEVLPSSELNGQVLSTTLRVTSSLEENPFKLSEVRVETPAFKPELATISVETGQDITLVYEPEDRYSFQMLRTLGFSKRGELLSIDRPKVPLWSALVFLFATLSLLALSWASNYEVLPTATSSDSGYLFFSLVSGSFVTAVLYWLVDKHFPTLSPTFKEYASCFFLSSILSLMLAAITLPIINGFRASGPLHSQEVLAEGLWQRTRYFMVREYTLKYREKSDGEVHSLRLWPSQLPSREVSKTNLIFRKGRLGWPYLVDIEFE